MNYEVCLMIWKRKKSKEGPAGQSCLARRRNPQFFAGNGVLARKTQTASSGGCGILVFWAGTSKNAVLGTPAPCVFGTWHVAVWIFGPQMRVVTCSSWGPSSTRSAVLGEPLLGVGSPSCATPEQPLLNQAQSGDGRLVSGSIVENEPNPCHDADPEIGVPGP